MILATVQHKGGVGKTTVTVNLASGFSEHLKKRTLVIDLDGQRNATVGMLGRAFLGLPAPTVEHFLRREVALEEAVRVYPRDDGLHILPGSTRLYQWMDEMVKNPDVAMLRAAEVRADLRKHYDVVVIDTPPSEQWASEFALLIADGYLMPAQPHGFAEIGIDDTLAMANAVQPRNPDLRAIGILMTLVRGGFGDHAMMIQEFAAAYGSLLLPFNLPLKAEYSRWSELQEPLVYAKGNPGGTLFRLLAEDVWKRLTTGYDGMRELLARDADQGRSES